MAKHETPKRRGRPPKADGLRNKELREDLAVANIEVTRLSAQVEILKDLLREHMR